MQNLQVLEIMDRQLAHEIEEIKKHQVEIKRHKMAIKNIQTKIKKLEAARKEYE